MFEGSSPELLPTGLFLGPALTAPHPRMAPLGRQSKDWGPRALGRDARSHNGPNSLILAGESAQATHRPIRRVDLGKK